MIGDKDKKYIEAGGGRLNDRENERAHLHNHKKQDAPYSWKLQTRK